MKLNINMTVEETAMRRWDGRMAAVLLMGAFGVALEAKDRLRRGVLDRGEFDLADLAAREVERLKPFICRGGAEKCDRGC